RDAEGDGRIDARDLLDDEGVVLIAHPGAVVPLREDHPEVAHLSHGAEDRVREFLGLVQPPGVRRDLALGELAHAAAKEGLLLGELEVHDDLRSRTRGYQSLGVSARASPIAITAAAMCWRPTS